MSTNQGDRIMICDACTSVQQIRIFRDVDGSIAVEINGVWQDLGQIEALARADGYRSVGAFFAYFKRKGLPFRGVLIKWSMEVPHA